MKKKIPEFRNEEEEFEFWSKAERVKLPADRIEAERQKRKGA
jgi:hypothetical protein